jgi:hypothetical protein
MDLDTLNDAIDMIREARDDLISNPALAQDDGWRENVEEIGYRVSTLLSSEDD